MQYFWFGRGGSLGMVVASLGEGNSRFLRNVLVHSVTGILSNLTKSRAEYKKKDMGGHAAEHIHFEDRPADVEMWHFLIDGRLYVVFANLSDEEAEAVRKSFKRLPSP